MASTSTTALPTGSVIVITFATTLFLSLTVIIFVTLLKARKRERSKPSLKRSSSLQSTFAPRPLDPHAHAALPPPPAILKHWEPRQVLDLLFMGRSSTGQSLHLSLLLSWTPNERLFFLFLFLFFLLSRAGYLLPIVHCASLPNPVPVDKSSVWDPSSTRQLSWGRYPPFSKLASMSPSPSLSTLIADYSVIIDIQPSIPEAWKCTGSFESGALMNDLEGGAPKVYIVGGSKVVEKEEVVRTKEQHRAAALARLEGREYVPSDEDEKEL
jgi:hypothetical protein